MSDTSKQAFPMQTPMEEITGPMLKVEGMTLREYYAAHAPPLPPLFWERWFSDFDDYPGEDDNPSGHAGMRHWFRVFAVTTI